MTFRCGLIVNPIAGIGGEAGLAGSDGADIQAVARRRGGVSPATERAVRAVRAVRQRVPGVELVTGAGALGEDACRRAGAAVRTVYSGGRPTTAADTRALAAALRDEEVDVLLFAGGDGTARDVCAAIGTGVIAAGIPAGVKMHSAVFAVTPEQIGTVVDLVASGRGQTHAAEVMDIDESARRRGVLGARLYGHLRVPRAPRAMQGGKVGSSGVDPRSLASAAVEVAERLRPGVPCLLGPGTTVREVGRYLGVEPSLLGVDLLEDGALHRDLSGVQLSAAIGARRFQVLVSPVGGQGVVLGRGNQQIGAGLLDRLDPDDLLLVCSPAKLAELSRQGLLCDAPTEQLNSRFRGPRRVIVGWRECAYVRLR